ncbi:hypothetical protein K443DRAFT_672350, partial [Laccaria amethystina LaAM-08-1]
TQNNLLTSLWPRSTSDTHTAMPCSASTCPLPLIPSSQAAPTFSMAGKSNPTASKVTGWHT